MNYDTIIIGAGPAGMTAAIFAAKKGLKVCLVEHEDRVGKKILSTGNGKCNITNMNISPNCYYTGSKGDFYGIIEKFMPEDIIAFFKELGVLTLNKNGYIYPRSEQASMVLDCLRGELERLNIKVYTEANDARITHKEAFTVSFNKTKITGKKLILCCGGKAAPKTGSDGSGYKYAKELGHPVIKVIPALVQLICKESFYKELQGVRCNATVKVMVDNNKIAEDTGEVQLTGYGISGIPVFQISRLVKRHIDKGNCPVVSLDFVNEYNHKELFTFIKNNVDTHPDMELSQALSGILNKKLAIVIIKECNLKPSTKCFNITTDNITYLVDKIKDFRVVPKDTNGFDNAQVCAGGVSLNEVNLDTMESKLVKGLYFAGEILDVDGKCGGYNLTWAFASGKVAGDNQ